MALIVCPDCSTQVSDQAMACPKCGRPTARGASYVAAPAKAGMGTAATVLVIVGVAVIAVIAIVGVLAVLSVAGTRKYIANAKRAEVMSSLGQLAKDAVTAYEESGANGQPRHLCASASKSVPADRAAISGKKYQSSAADWATDKDRDAGFACLKFEMTMPQYYEYEYVSDAQGFTVRAHGDLNGNGVYSTYEIHGRITDDRVVVDPTISETNGGE
jgi:type II secretory pathway pseudopilin PulG